MKIFAVGMNYRLHTEELLGSDYEAKGPVVFTKCESALLTAGRPFFVPSFTRECHYEAELVVRVSRLGRSIAPRWAHRYYDALTVGVDFTARDLQRELMARGEPWDIAKGFDGSAAIGTWVSKDEFADVGALHFHLDLNGHTVQRGFTGDMLHSVDAIVSHLSRFFTLKMGDLIFTGTPAGVGPVSVGDRLEGYLEGRQVLAFNVK